jgi:hypothetical protein
MSRSRKKVARGFGYSGMKSWKQEENRKFRRTNKVLLEKWYGDDDMYLLSQKIERGNLWGSPCDGHNGYFGNMKYPVIEDYTLYFRDTFFSLTKSNVEKFLYENFFDYEDQKKIRKLVEEEIGDEDGDSYRIYYKEASKTYDEQVKEDQDMYRKLMRK